MKEAGTETKTGLTQASGRESTICATIACDARGFSGMGVRRMGFRLRPAELWLRAGDCSRV
jgi:hypothetical protein